MPRNSITMARTAITTRRIGVQNFPYSLYFPGTNGNDMSVGTDSYPYERTQARSIAFWIRPVAYPSANGHIFAAIQGSSPFRGWLSRLQTTGGVTSLNFYLISTVNTNQLIANYAAPAIGKWTRVVETYSGNSNTSGVNVYYNNVLQTQTSVTNTLSATTVASGVVAKWGGFAGASQNANMHLDKPEIFNYELTAEQVADDWFEHSVDTPPVDTYAFTEGLGTDVASTGTGEHDGTLGAGVTWSSTVVPMKSSSVLTQARLAVS